MAIFELFRISLTKRESIQLKLFSNENKQISRQDFLNEVFSDRIIFFHQSNEFHFIRINNLNLKDKIIGKIGRPIVSEENLPPEQGFEEAEHTGWKASIIVIDPAPHEDGQKISFQKLRDVGESFALIKSLVKKINEKKDSIYHIEIEPIFSSRTFWDFVEKNKGEITNIKFNFTTPNMFGSSDELSKELAALRDNEKAQKVELTLKSDDGLETNTERLKQAVEYAQKGTGEIRAISKNGKRYNSIETTASILINDDKKEGSLLNRVLNQIKTVLGYE